MSEKRLRVRALILFFSFLVGFARELLGRCIMKRVFFEGGSRCYKRIFTAAMEKASTVWPSTLVPICCHVLAGRCHCCNFFFSTSIQLST